MDAVRLPDNPIITPESHPSIGTNINGPSLIRAPEWLPSPLGRYYLYFAAHAGGHIRLAYADRVEGPYTVHEAGTLRLDQTRCRRHIASPDILVDDNERRIVMFFHGGEHPDTTWQTTCMASSTDGVSFVTDSEPLGRSYWRVFAYQGWFYSLEMSGRLRRSKTVYGPYEDGPDIRDAYWRHLAVLVDGDRIHLFFTNKGDAPEHVRHCLIDPTSDWHTWRVGESEPVLMPEREYEGGGLPVEPSSKGPINARVCQLRDPCVYSEGDRTWLLYSVAGERGIAIAELEL